MRGFDNILKRDMAAEPYTVNESEMESYKAVTESLREMAAKGNLDFEADDPATPYAYHLISIKLKLIDELVSVELNDLRELCKGNGNLTIMPYDATDWLISYELYQTISL